MDNEVIVTLFASLGAGLSFAAFAFPFLQKSDKKEKYRSIIEKRRKDLFQSNRDGTKIISEESVSARDSMAMFYRFQKLAGKMADKSRDKMLQAGIRNPKAHIKFMLTRAIAPVVFVIFSSLYFSILPEDKSLSPAVEIAILILGALSCFKLPDILIKNKIIKRQEEINLSFPDALDMMLICVQGGIGLEQTIERVAGEVADNSEVLAEELGILSAELAMLNDRRQALNDFSRRVGSGAGKNFANALIQAEQYGTSVSNVMRVMSDELREIRMSEAERKAAALPPMLTVPMILFFLPALFIVILGPAGISVSATFGGG
ncbi:MAG: type II secretion system F family protein [Alphaproteobacteria bacterium]|nr:type II secretion system F family protein [Alphaproteobacteria bacterium]